VIFLKLKMTVIASSPSESDISEKKSINRVER
jgi:hypothetical protein